MSNNQKNLEFIKENLSSLSDENMKKIREIMLKGKKPVRQKTVKSKSSVPVIKQMDSALRGSARSYGIRIMDNKSVLVQLNKTRLPMKHKLTELLSELKGFKFIETIKVNLSKESTSTSVFANSNPQLITSVEDIMDTLQLSQQKVLGVVDRWISQGSGWTIDHIDSHHLNITIYKPLKGSSYIKLPAKLSNPMKGLINLKNNDNECFRWCHIRHLNPQERNPQRIKQSDKECVEKLNYDGVTFPVTVKQINKIEKQNKININLFGYEAGETFPIRISTEQFKGHMELLFITEEGKSDGHYVLISNFNRFMFDKTKHNERKHFCMRCLQCFSSDRVLKTHEPNCIKVNGTQAIKMPDKDNNILGFSGHHKQQPVPFVIYADVEAITKKIQGCQPDEKKSFTEVYQEHSCCSFGYKVVCHYDDRYTKPLQTYRGEKPIFKFLEKMLEEVEYCKGIVKDHFNKPLAMTEQDIKDFESANKCHICDKTYVGKDVRVRDHCHVTGRFRGSAHQECNLKLQISAGKLKVPVVFHNLRGYDSHFLMQEMGNIVKTNVYKNKKGRECEMTINAIPNNM